MTEQQLLRHVDEVNAEADRREACRKGIGIPRGYVVHCPRDDDEIRHGIAAHGLCEIIDVHDSEWDRGKYVQLACGRGLHFSWLSSADQAVVKAFEANRERLQAAGQACKLLRAAIAKEA